MAIEISKKKAAAWILATVVAPLALYFWISGWYIGIWYARTRHQGPPPANILFQGIMIGFPAALWGTVGLWWLIRRKKAAFSELFGARTQGLAGDLAVGVALGAAWVAMYGLGNVVSFSQMFTFDLAKLSSVPTSLSAGFCEEFLFRGFLFLIIAQAGGRRTSQILWTSLAFGLGHVFWGPWGMFWTMVLGMTLGAVTSWRRSVWSAVTAHAILDLCIEPALIQKAMTGGFNT